MYQFHIGNIYVKTDACAAQLVQYDLLRQEFGDVGVETGGCGRSDFNPVDGCGRPTYGHDSRGVRLRR